MKQIIVFEMHNEKNLFLRETC